MINLTRITGIMVDMPVIVGARIEAHCASITGMIRHYAAGGQ